MDRILSGTSQAATVTIQSDGVPVDADAIVFVTATRADGTILVNNVAAAHTGTGKYQVVLTAAQTALLDLLSLTWSFSISGQASSLRTQVEIVGGFLFS